MFNFLVHAPVFLLFIVVLIQKGVTPLYSLPLLQFCIKEELVFRTIPFQYINRSVFYCILSGILNGFYVQYVIQSSPIYLLIHAMVGCAYTIGRLRYSVIETIQLRYFLVAFLMATNDVN